MRKREKRERRGWAALFLAAAMVLAVIFGDMGAVSAAEPTYEGSNLEAQNYSRWASPIYSYLAHDESGFMRVQAGDRIEGVLVEYYDNDFQFRRALVVPEELPLFGGFCETDSGYYLVTGQENRAQSASAEVFRITKYDKSWNRIASAGLKDCNTTEPFDAGSVRMAQCGKYLLIRTSHEMYRSSDGWNHQANVTIEVDTERMEITDSYTKVMNNSYGYVSHSFNQFIGVENNRIVALDHGDAYPRSIVLTKYRTDASAGKFVPGYGNGCRTVNVMSFPGSVGENTTGASVGGFAIADGYYLAAGNSVVQDARNLTRRTRNVFVAAVSKSTDSVAVNWLTDYAEGDGTVSTPQMVKIADGRYAVLWSRDGTVFYTRVDGSGKKIGETYQLSGNLSDCVPIVAGDRLVWYTWKRESIRFYSISLSSFGTSSVKEVRAGQNGWVWEDGDYYWYENGLKQGTEGRGKEIYDKDSDAWYWLDAVQGGRVAKGKDVYQESLSAYPDREDGTGKWVRYDSNGHMVKGWQTTEAGIYYFEEITGAMAKGNVTINGGEYYFDPVTGILQRGRQDE